MRVVDRFLMKSTMRSREKGERPGIERLIESLSASTELVQLQVFTALEESLESRGATEQFLSILGAVKSNSIAERVELCVNLVEDSLFGKHAHGRYVRGDQRVITLDTGLEILCGERVYRNCPASLSHNYKEKRELENLLDRRSKRVCKL